MRADRIAARNVGGPMTDRAIQVIIDRTALEFRVTPARLKGRQRAREIVRPRHVAMLICQRVTGASISEIGLAFNRNHATVAHGITQAGYMIERDADIDFAAARVKRDVRAILGVEEVIVAATDCLRDRLCEMARTDPEAVLKALAGIVDREE